MTPVIRPGRDDDALGFIALIGDCWAEHPGIAFDVDAELPELRALAAHIAARGGALWAAEQCGAVVGMIAAYPADDGWHLCRFYVASRHRGSGLAGRLLSAVEEHVRAAGGHRLALWTDVLFTRAHAFYEKHGFVRRGGLRSLPDLSNTIEACYAKPLAGLVIGTLDMAAAESAERRLTAVLQDCVGNGASVSFLPPLATARAMAYWRGITRAVGRNEVRLLAAWQDGLLCGTVQVALDMPENQPHRADIRKLLVSETARGRGIGRALMLAAEDAARLADRRLLVLDTLAGGDGERLYRSLAWEEAGTIPDYALDASGRGYATRYFYKAV